MTLKEDCALKWMRQLPLPAGAGRSNDARRGLSGLLVARLSSVTSEAADAARAQLFVIVANQLDHLARNLFGWFVIFVELIVDMTIGAINSQRTLEGGHHLWQPVGREPAEYLNVLVLLLRPLLFARGGQRVQRRQLDGTRGRFCRRGGRRRSGRL